MQYLIVLSLIAAVASAGYLKPTVASGELAQIQEIIQAINSPSTDPATAAALEQMLFETLGVTQQPSPVDISPVLIDFPVPVDVLPAPETPAVVAEPAPVPAPETPAVVAEPAPVAVASSPLVQIIVNVNSAAASEVAEAPVVAAPAPVPAPVVDVSPVIVVEEAQNLPIAVPEPVQVVEVAPTPVLVVDAAPEPVLVGEIVIPVAPVVTLPDTLN